MCFNAITLLFYATIMVMFKTVSKTTNVNVMVICKTVSKTTNVNVNYKLSKLTEITQKLSQINKHCL